jgi:fibronectin type 3 domain-containing protein
MGGVTAYAQRVEQARPEQIKVIARQAPDSIVLRWAPINVGHWQKGNQYGYEIMRYTLVRAGKVVQPVEQKKLTAFPLRPIPEEQWESFTGNKYGLVAAQALYGETFEMNIDPGNVMQIVNKARENEQRYSIALFCADMSPSVARGLALRWNDKQPEKDVKYLYRLRIFTPTDTLQGSVFVNTAEKYELPLVKGLSVESKGPVVTLRWDREEDSPYTTYIVERSTDGKVFTSISDVSGVALSPREKESKYQYAVDTVSDVNRDYSYRIRGVTPFTEAGTPSAVVKIRTQKTVTSSIFVTSAISADNKSVDVQWEFPDSENDALKGFELSRATTSQGPYKPVHKQMLPVSVRAFRDLTAGQVNYYKVKATAHDGTEVVSMPYLAMLVDSVPPSAPVGLKGKVDDKGNVTIHWTPNKDVDIYGYRVYRAYYQSEEFALMTGEAVKDTVFSDRVELASLNEKVHYQVMALDRNQNHSPLSTVLSLALPDKVPPQAPAWRPVKSEKQGVVLSWDPSGSQDVVRYVVYRRTGASEWLTIATLPATGDTLYTYTDKSMASNGAQQYTLIAVDEAGLESPPAPVVTGVKLPELKKQVELNKPVVDRERKRITISWSYDMAEVVSYKIFKKVDNGDMKLYRTIRDRQLEDAALVAGSTYTYSVMAVFADGSTSKLNPGVTITY